MEAAVSSSRTLLQFPTNIKTSTKNRVNISVFSKSNGHYSSYMNRNGRLKHRRLKLAISDVSIAAADDIGKVEVTWQITVGAIAGITPFVVAGIQFSKRIIAQRRCEVCGGSGLVLRDKDYFRCPGCGGFLPWQSWKRFFSG